jgi:hypothetical protein
MLGSAVFGRPAPARWAPMKYSVMLLLPMAVGACQEPSILQPPLEVVPASGLTGEFRACVSSETAAIVQRVSSRGQVALIARHDEMNRDVAAACKTQGRILKPDETSYVAREIDKAATKPIDFRKGADGLVALVHAEDQGKTQLASRLSGQPGELIANDLGRSAREHARQIVEVLANTRWVCKEAVDPIRAAIPGKMARRTKKVTPAAIEMIRCSGMLW